MAINIKRSVTLGELLTAGIAVIGCVLSFWLNTNVRLNALELNQKNAEKKYEDLSSSLQKLDDKMDKISENLNILIGELRNDRK